MELAPEVILDRLLASGKISAEDIEQVSKEGASVQQLANLLHIVCCDLDHNSECEYYKEAALERPWGAPSHKLWMDRYTDVREAIGKDISDYNVWRALSEALRTKMDCGYATKVVLFYMARGFPSTDDEDKKGGETKYGQ